MIFSSYKPQDILPDDADNATLIGRAWRPDIGPALITLRNGNVFDITSHQAATMSSLLEKNELAEWVKSIKGEMIGSIADILSNSDEAYRNPNLPYLLSPVDLQAVKAAGVTFAVSLLERVIEERARGVPEDAAEIRDYLRTIIGDDLRLLEPGSARAAQLKSRLVEKGLWSQYLEVGLGPDPEVFTKCQVMSSVGFGANVGIDERSSWNNPEPEIALVVSAAGRIIGATLANDVNLRDFEGRSALLLPKAKDNNASCSLGPFIRIFDKTFGYDDILKSKVKLQINGPEGFTLEDVSDMQEISRAPASLVEATIGHTHQYPDGFVLLLGTMFAPTIDRNNDNTGFTHKPGDIVSISSPKLGRLINRVEYCPNCAPWTFGIKALMQNLSHRDLI